jgi:lipopolysaccharide transport system permease protein
MVYRLYSLMHTLASSDHSTSFFQGLMSIRSPWRTYCSTRGLVVSLARREILARYAGAFLGGAWAVISPLVMLAIYSFVFGVVFRGKWGQGSEQSLATFAIVIFCGISAFNIFQECVVKAPSLVVAQPNLVKRVVFPTEILAMSAVGAALFQAGINFALVVAANYLVAGVVHWTVVLLPLTLLPLVFLTLGVSWLLSSMGVFFRDVQQMVGLLANALLFLTPIFFSLEMLPPQVRAYAALNPLASIVESIRAVVLWGVIPHFHQWIVSMIISWIVMQIGYAIFMRLKPTFADVI